MANFEISWEAPEYEYREKGVAWYWTSIILAAAVVAFAVWQRNFLFGIFIVLAEILFIVWGNREPHNMKFSVTSDGISITGEGGRSYSLKEFDSMSIDQHGDGWAELIFVFRPKLKSPLKCLIPEDKLADLRLNLRPILKETPYEPTLIDSIEKILRF